MIDPANSSNCFRPVVVLPTYNNCGTLPDILNRIMALALPLIVVNDGSTDGTAGFLLGWKGEDASRRATIILSHKQNRGKAAALQTGFLVAIAAGYSHAVTIDSDGQLDPEQIPDLLAVASEQPTALVLGVRDATRSDYPAKSRLGRLLSNFMIRLECGVRVSDSQCGFRVYPLSLIQTARCKAGRFGYEAEIITRAAWLGHPIREVPVNCRYFTEGDRVTHFKLRRDTLEGTVLHMRLLLCTLAASRRPKRMQIP